MLKRMGHKEGESVGQSNTGRVEPIPIEVKTSRSGLGSQDNNVERCLRSGASSVRKSTGSGQQRSCYRCGKAGHLARGCANKGALKTGQRIKCYECGEFGHLARDCEIR